MKYSNWLLILLFITLFSCNFKVARRDRFLIMANNELKSGNYDKALSLYDEAIRLDPDLAEAWNNRGVVLFGLEQYIDAIESYTRAFSLEPGNPGILLNRSNAYYKTREFYKALEDINRADEWLPDTSVIPFLRGTILFELGNYDSAGHEFLASLQMDSMNEEALVNLATVHLFNKSLEESENILHRLFSIDPGNTDGMNVMSTICLRKNKLDEALTWLDQAISLSPENAFYLNNRGYVYIQLDNLERGLQDINASLLLDPFNAWVYRNKGIYYLKIKDYVKSLEFLEKSIRINNRVELTHYYLGLSYEALGRISPACEAFWLSAEAGEEEGRKEFQRLCSE